MPGRPPLVPQDAGCSAFARGSLLQHATLQFYQMVKVPKIQTSAAATQYLPLTQHRHNRIRQRRADSHHRRPGLCRSGDISGHRREGFGGTGLEGGTGKMEMS